MNLHYFLNDKVHQQEPTIPFYVCEIKKSNIGKYKSKNVELTKINKSKMMIMTTWSICFLFSIVYVPSMIPMFAYAVLQQELQRQQPLALSSSEWDACVNLQWDHRGTCCWGHYEGVQGEGQPCKCDKGLEHDGDQDGDEGRSDLPVWFRRTKIGVKMIFEWVQ
jgi:hypothetical protein